MKKASLVLTMVLGLVILLTITAAISYAMSKEDEALIKKIDGRRYTWIQPWRGGGTLTWILDVKGNVLVSGRINNCAAPKCPPHRGYEQTGRPDYEIQGSVTTIQNQNPEVSDDGSWVMYMTFTISEDGETITERWHWSNTNQVTERIHFWQR